MLEQSMVVAIESSKDGNERYHLVLTVVSGNYMEIKIYTFKRRTWAQVKNVKQDRTSVICYSIKNHMERKTIRQQYYCERVNNGQFLYS